jgi:putative OPT family oligopeptide transporter
LLLCFAFLFAAVTSYTVGYIGTSSNPVSGMILTTILITCSIYYLLGWTGASYLLSALMLGSVVTIAVAIAGDTSQDLKTGHLVGATPMKQQIGMVIGVVASALFMGSTIYLLNAAYTFGSMSMPAPQATLLYLVSKGVLHGDLPITLMGIGFMVGLTIFLLRIPVMPFAIGMYLPLSLNTAVAVGGFIAYLLRTQLSHARAEKRGILFASGLVGGDSIFGVLAALLAVSGWTRGSAPLFPAGVGTAIYCMIAALLALYVRRAAK